MKMKNKTNHLAWRVSSKGMNVYFFDNHDAHEFLNKQSVGSGFEIYPITIFGELNVQGTTELVELCKKLHALKKQQNASRCDHYLQALESIQGFDEKRNEILKEIYTIVEELK